jgi:hypothetical protein
MRRKGARRGVIGGDGGRPRCGGDEFPDLVAVVRRDPCLVAPYVLAAYAWLWRGEVLRRLLPGKKHHFDVYRGSSHV